MRAVRMRKGERTMSILGDDFEVVGDDDEVMGEEYGEEVGQGLRGRMKLAQRRPMLRLPPKPGWRRQIAPGVAMPGQGLEPLPLTPNLNNGVFDAANQAIEFTGRPQAPFRAERLLASVRRSAGAPGVLIFAQTIIIGRQVQTVEVGQFDVEFFAANAFGVRLNLVQADPGILIRIPCTAVPAVPVGETVAVSLLFLGRTIR